MILTPEGSNIGVIHGLCESRVDPGGVEYRTIYPSIRLLRGREMIDFLPMFDPSGVFRNLTLDSHNVQFPMCNAQFSSTYETPGTPGKIRGAACRYKTKKPGI